MAKRIVDETFAKDLSETDLHSIERRLDYFREYRERITDDTGLSAKKKPSWIGRMLFRFIRPLLEPYFIQQIERECEIVENLQLLVSNIIVSLNGLSRSVHDVYIKSGEALAVLNNDIVKDFDERIEQARNSAKITAKEIVADETAVQMDHLKLESKKIYQELITRSDLFIKHLESELETMEKDLDYHVVASALRIEWN